MFTCDGWQVTQSDPIPLWKVTLRSCVMGYVPLTAIQYLYSIQQNYYSLFCKLLLSPWDDGTYSQAREKQMPFRLETAFLL